MPWSGYLFELLEVQRLVLVTLFTGCGGFNVRLGPFLVKLKLLCINILQTRKDLKLCPEEELTCPKHAKTRRRAPTGTYRDVTSVWRL